MAVSPGDIILAAQFNTLRNRTDNLLGNGVSDFGYGQPVLSNEVSAGAVVTATRLSTLHSDISRVNVHQSGSPLSIDTIVAGDVIGADQSGSGLTYTTPGNYTFDNPNATKGYNDYLSLLTVLETNRFNIAAGQSDVTLAVASDARTLTWSYVAITSEFTVTFTTTNARRHFFNSGGQLIISGTVVNLDVGSPSYARNLGWSDMITNPGQVQIGYNYIRASAPGASNIVFLNGLGYGNYQFTSTYQEIFRKNAAGSVYENSYWTVEGRNDSANIMRFRVTLVDAGSESGGVLAGTQEPVTADITMNYGTRLAVGDPTGQSVTLPNPVFSVVNTIQ
jgi:hypothetical protein